MAERVILRPAPGRRCTDPATGAALPERGALVELGQYWLRRLADGDVVRVAEPPASAPPPPAGGSA